MNRLRKLAYQHYLSHYSNINSIPDGFNETNIQKFRSSFDIHFGSMVNNLPENSRVLDIGCGVGFLLDWLSQKPGLTVEGVDAGKPIIELARTIHPDTITLHHGDAADFLPRYSECFDCIFAIDVIEHMETDDDLLDMLLAVYHALKPNGVFALRVPNMSNLTAARSRYVDITHAQGFTQDSLAQCLESAGFHQLSIFGYKPEGFLQTLRVIVENALHRFVYRICGINRKYIFSNVLYSFCTKPAANGFMENEKHDD